MTTESDNEFDPLPHGGNEVVLAADFDRHGTRLVTGSADHRIRVFDLNDKTKEWRLIEAWRAHNADVVDRSSHLNEVGSSSNPRHKVKFHPRLSRPGFLASIGSDLRLKLWYENTLESTRSGRRFRCIYSQSPSHGVAYTSIDFACPPSLTSPVSPYSTILAAITRDGLLSLLEPTETPGGTADPLIPGSAAGAAAAAGVPSGGPVGAAAVVNPGAGGPAAAAAAAARKISVPGGLDEWREVDQIWVVADGGVSRGTETCFRLAFQRGDAAGAGAGPSYTALEAGMDARTLTLAVTSLDTVAVYRLAGAGADGDVPYHFRAPACELTGARGLVRDVAWAPAGWRPRDRLATASADGSVRIYEIWTPEGEQRQHHHHRHDGLSSNAAGAGAAMSRIGSTTNARSHVASGISAGLSGGIGGGGGRHASDRRQQYAPGQMGHRWELVSELKHPGCWKVAWLREGSMLASTADSGKAMIWAQSYDGAWKEFADFGAEGDPALRPRN